MSDRARARMNDMLITVVTTAFLALQAWTLKSVVDLQGKVARLDTKLTDHISQTALK